MTLDELTTYCEMMGWSVHYPTQGSSVLRLLNRPRDVIMDGKYRKGCMIEVWYPNSKPNSEIFFYTCDRDNGTDSNIRTTELTDDMVNTFISYY